MSDLESKTSKTGEPGFPAQVVEEVSRHDDVAGAFLAKVAKEAPELLADWAPAEEKRLIRWKIEYVFPIFHETVSEAYETPSALLS